MKARYMGGGTIDGGRSTARAHWWSQFELDCPLRLHAHARTDRWREKKKRYGSISYGWVAVDRQKHVDFAKKSHYGMDNIACENHNLTKLGQTMAKTLYCDNDICAPADADFTADAFNAFNAFFEDKLKSLRSTTDRNPLQEMRSNTDVSPMRMHSSSGRQGLANEVMYSGSNSYIAPHR